MGLNHSPPATSTQPPPPPPPPPLPVQASNTMTLGTTTTAAVPSPQVQVSGTVTASTSAIVSSIPTMTSMTSPVTTSAFTPSHTKYRATLQTYVGEPQEKSQFLLPEDEAQNWGFRADPRSQASTPIFEAADDVSSVKSRSIKSQKIDDPHPGLSFEERKKMETQEARTFYKEQTNRMSPKTKEFQKNLQALNQVLKRKCPPMDLAFQIMGDLTQTWLDIKFHRKLALSKMSHWTKENDTNFQRNKCIKKPKNHTIINFSTLNLEERKKRKLMMS